MESGLLDTSENNLSALDYFPAPAPDGLSSCDPAGAAGHELREIDANRAVNKNSQATGLWGLQRSGRMTLTRKFKER